ncbi:MAG: hypothetical protein JWP97_5948 [Labilithrix sp.]|nr:hypothetical protein [Labilithrix sp.]
MPRLALGSWFVVPVLVAACGSDDHISCTLVDCGDPGVRIDFTETAPGAYAVDVVVDGSAGFCTATLPLGSANDGCTLPDLQLVTTGSSLQASQQSIGGLRVARKDAKSITIHVTRDGQPVREATFSPAYRSTPGPNGPACEPKECTQAVFTLP